MKVFVLLVKSFFLATFVLYVFNIMASVIDCYIPINLLSISIVGLLGISGLMTIVIYMFLIF